MITKTTIDQFVTTYGPFAFGVITLLIIWMIIIQPELKSNRLDFETHRKLLETQGAQNIQQEQTARTIRDTALILERVAKSLERITIDKQRAEASSTHDPS